MSRTVRFNMPMKLEGSYNTRDLGGYPVQGGGNTANGQFLRSDKPTRFTEADKQRLYDYGVRLVVDFRSFGETQREPCALKDYKDIEYINPQLIDNIHSNIDGARQFSKTLSDLYIGFLDNKRDVFLPVFKTILDRHMDDCVFFNCTAGKDRTGTFAMILLKLAGVPDDVIVIDYKPTGDNIKEDMDKLLYASGRVATPEFEDMLRSRPIHMEKTLEHFNNTYGTMESWLGLVGLTQTEIAQLKNKILGNF